MSRPRKQRVDYFSHDTDASGGKTLTILESQFGVAGYAFWFKLLEWLGHTDGHYYDAREPGDLEFLLRKCGVPEPEILHKLAFLGAIDQTLWDHKVIWSQNFVDRLKDVYKKREVPLPQKPCFCDGNCGHLKLGGTIPVTETPVPTTGITPLPPTPPIPLNNNKVNNSSSGNSNDNIFQIYEEEIGKITPMVAERLKDLEQQYPAADIIAAIKEAVKNNVRKLTYIEKILESWQEHMGIMKGEAEGGPLMRYGGRGAVVRKIYLLEKERAGREPAGFTDRMSAKSDEELLVMFENSRQELPT